MSQEHYISVSYPYASVLDSLYHWTWVPLQLQGSVQDNKDTLEDKQMTQSVHDPIFMLKIFLKLFYELV